jgi:transposase-like protein
MTLWRVVVSVGGIPATLSSQNGKAAALKLMRNLLGGTASPVLLATNKLASDRAAHRELSLSARMIRTCVRTTER